MVAPNDLDLAFYDGLPPITLNPEYFDQWFDLWEIGHAAVLRQRSVEKRLVWNKIWLQVCGFILMLETIQFMFGSGWIEGFLMSIWILNYVLTVKTVAQCWELDEMNRKLIASVATAMVNLGQAPVVEEPYVMLSVQEDEEVDTLL